MRRALTGEYSCVGSSADDKNRRKSHRVTSCMRSFSDELFVENCTEFYPVMRAVVAPERIGFCSRARFHCDLTGIAADLPEQECHPSVHSEESHGAVTDMPWNSR